MFYKCSGLTSVDLSIFDTRNVKSMRYMFSGCIKLKTSIIIKNVGTTSYDSMFTSAATEEGAEIIVNYTDETSELVDNMIKAKSDNSHVIKGEKVSI